MVLFLPHEAASVPVSRQVLDGCLETLGVTPDTRADIALALTEACANVIQHARSDDQYEVQVRARNGQCAIEVVNAGSGNGEPAPYRGEDDEGWAGAMALGSDPVPATAEHGRGLKIINAVVDNLQLTGNEREGRTVHFEKTLDWLPGAAGQHLSSVDGARRGAARPGREPEPVNLAGFRGRYVRIHQGGRAGRARDGVLGPFPQPFQRFGVAERQGRLQP